MYSDVRSRYGLFLSYFSEIFISGKNENIGKICKRTITWMDCESHLLDSTEWKHQSKVLREYKLKKASVVQDIFSFSAIYPKS